MSLKINNDNYETYKKVFAIFCKYFHAGWHTIIPAGAHPMAVLNDMEKKSKSIAKQALKIGINDCLSSLNEYPKATIVVINTELEKENLPNLNKLMGAVRGSIKKVLQAKQIKGEVQYYMIKELLDDTVSDITPEERISLSIYMNDFEIKATKR